MFRTRSSSCEGRREKFHRITILVYYTVQYHLYCIVIYYNILYYTILGLMEQEQEAQHITLIYSTILCLTRLGYVRCRWVER